MFRFRLPPPRPAAPPPRPGFGVSSIRPSFGSAAPKPRVFVNRLGVPAKKPCNCGR